MGRSSKNVYVNLIGILAITLLSNCQQEEFSLSPSIPDPFLYKVSYGNSQREDILITFSSAVDFSTFVLDSTIVIKGGFTPTEIPKLKSVNKILLSGEFDPGFCENQICLVHLEINGDSTNNHQVIKSLEGQLLDVDKNGTDGGYFDGIIRIDP